MEYDLLIKEGRVIDASQGLDAVMDVALAHGRVAGLARAIPRETAARTIDAAGRLVTPGLIDMHAHVFVGATWLGIEADPNWLAYGATTALDAGSAGAVNIDAFRRFCVEPARGRILALLNISSVGMPFGVGPVSEVSWLPLADVDAAVAAVERQRDLVLGLKVRLSRGMVGENGIQPLYRALEAAGRTGLPIMVHPGDTPVPLAEILDLMRPGDILTHTYTAAGCITEKEKNLSWQDLPEQVRHAGLTILDADGRVIPQAWDARERGVIMDVGHGFGSFSFAVCAPAIEQSFTPDTMGSDLHSVSRQGPVHNLPTMISRFLSLGLTLKQVIEAVTARPAQVLGMAGEIGTLRPGAAGDVAIMDLLDGEFEYRDAPGRSLRGRHKLSPWLTVRAGQIVAAG
jgi:dihydroorotase